MRGEPIDSFEIKGSTNIKVDFQFGALEQSPAVVILDSHDATVQNFASTSSP